MGGVFGAANIVSGAGGCGYSGDDTCQSHSEASRRGAGLIAGAVYVVCLDDSSRSGGKGREGKGKSKRGWEKEEEVLIRFRHSGRIPAGAWCRLVPHGLSRGSRAGCLESPPSHAESIVSSEPYWEGRSWEGAVGCTILLPLRVSIRRTRNMSHTAHAFPRGLQAVIRPSPIMRCARPLLPTAPGGSRDSS